jgi:hypothetical protein
MFRPFQRGTGAASPLRGTWDDEPMSPTPIVSNERLAERRYSPETTTTTFVLPEKNAVLYCFPPFLYDFDHFNAKEEIIYMQRVYTFLFSYIFQVSEKSAIPEHVTQNRRFLPPKAQRRYRSREMVRSI